MRVFGFMVVVNHMCIQKFLIYFAPLKTSTFYLQFSFYFFGSTFFVDSGRRMVKEVKKSNYPNSNNRRTVSRALFLPVYSFFFSSYVSISKVGYLN